MFLKEFAFGIDHLWLYPNAKLYACCLSIAHQTWNAIGQLAVSYVPIAQTCMVVLARIFVGKPSIV